VVPDTFPKEESAEMHDLRDRLDVDDRDLAAEIPAG
jgi:hypothetical protein